MLLSLDHAVFGTMFICGTFGFFAGLFRSLLDLAAILLGLAAAIASATAPEIVKFAMEQTGVANEAYNKIVVMIVVFIAIQVLVPLLGWIGTIGADVEMTYGDRLLGFGLGAGRGFLLFVVYFLVNVVGYQYAGKGSPTPPPESFTYPAVTAAGRVILKATLPFLPPDVAAVAGSVRL